MTSARILVVEDDPEIGPLTRDMLAREGFAAELVVDGAGLDTALLRAAPDLVVLDVMLPGEDGFSICRRLRASSRTPILMLTARSDEIDRIVGLELGADDYLPKPFNPRELVARIRAILRRAAPPAPSRNRRRVLRASSSTSTPMSSPARAPISGSPRASSRSCAPSC